MSTPYIPIACALHDEYEIAIMHRKRLHIRWSDTDGEQRTALVMPKDILVKNREEFLVAELPEGDEICVRLDNISLLDQ